MNLPRCILFAGIVWMSASSVSSQADSTGAPVKPVEKLLPVRQIPWPDAAHSCEMFSALAAGPDGLVYAGTCTSLEKERVGAMLLTLDPKTAKQKILLDVMKVTGERGAKTFPQSKIHSQIRFDSKAVAWFGTHSYQWNTLQQYERSPAAYTGGYLLSYDTKTAKATNLGILAPHESIMSLAVADRVGKIYCVMHPTGRFVVYDVASKKARDLGAVLGFPCRAVVALSDGRGYTFTRDGRVVRYTPTTGKLEVLDVAIPDDQGESVVRGDDYYNNPFALVVSADQKHIYGTGWMSGYLFDYQPDEGAQGKLRVLGVAFGDSVVPGERRDLVTAMDKAPDGRIYYAGYCSNEGRVARFDPKTGKREYLGRMAVDGKSIAREVSDAISGALTVLQDGTVVVCTFNNHKTTYNLFHPER